jgi:hypothetical protein
MTNYTKYQHIERIGNDEVSNLCIGGECFIFPKLDGTNGTVFFDNNIVKCGSRNRCLDEEVEDNAGFRQYINSDMQIHKYNSFFKDNPNLILYGEWLVPHTVKNYLYSAWRKFYIFDICYIDNEELKYIPYNDYSKMLEKYELDFIQPLDIKINPSIDSLNDIAKSNNYLMEQGFFGEGIVVKRYDYMNKYGHTTWGKIIREEFKEDKYSQEKKHSSLEEEVVEKLLTDSLLEKEKAKIDNFSNKDIARFLGTVYHEFINEELWNIIKKYKNPIINFDILNKLIFIKCRKFLGL